jgi:hypothetical protein|tara:strand:+ start:403 stop:522 length:120 start_codon:yes stop_codon:yes gene_type:complete
MLTKRDGLVYSSEIKVSDDVFGETKDKLSHLKIRRKQHG